MSRLSAALVLASAMVSTRAHAQQRVLVGHATMSTVSVRLFASVGDVHVIGWDRDSVEMAGTVPIGSRVELSTGAPAERARGLKMFVEVPSDQSGRDGRLVLRVPRGARVWLKTGSADLDVTGVTGGLDLNVVGGSITVHGSPRELRAESMDGAVVVDGAPEWLRVKTATGDIVLHGGQDIGASTISGAIRSTGGEVERVKFESTTGAVALASGLARAASVELETHSGAIDVELPLRAEIDVDAATMTGVIENRWGRARPEGGREGRGMTLTSASAGTGGRVVIRTFKGTIRLATR